MVRGTPAWECDIWIGRTATIKEQSTICIRDGHLYGDVIVDFTILLQMFKSDTLSLSSLTDNSVKNFISVIALLVGRSVMVVPRIGHPYFQNSSSCIVN